GDERTRRRHGHTPAGWRVLHTVVDEIDQRLAEPNRYREDDRLAGQLGQQLDVLRLGSRLHHPERVADDRYEVDGLARRVETRLDLADVEQAGDEIGHVLGRVADVLTALGVARGARAGPPHRTP